jgi:archaellum biogenesis ATPase FlaH
MEQCLLAASLRSRQDYELIKSYIDMRASTYSKPFQIIMAKVGEYYQRDDGVTLVEPAILLAQIQESIRNAKHVTRFTELIEESLATTGSDINVRAAILMSKQQEVGDKLSQALAMDSTAAKVDDLIKELSALRAMTSLDELSEKGLEAYHDVDLESMIQKEYDPDSLIQLMPTSLNERLDGGVKGGDHVVVFAPVEAGKSAFCINAICGVARQTKRGLYVINEDRAESIIMRAVANLSGMNKYQIQADPRRAQTLANDAGFRNIIVLSAAPGTPQQIAEAVEQYEPEFVVVDQLRNLKVKAESRVNQLEAAATAVREIGKKYKVVMVSVTQAGDSARDKLILDTGDVDFSNVGIPAQADVMVGIGMNAQYEAENTRMISLPKNKISGRHENFPVRIIPQLSRIGKA